MNVTDQIVDAIHEVIRHGFTPRSIELGRVKSEEFFVLLQGVQMTAPTGYGSSDCDGEFHGLPLRLNRSPGIAVSFTE